MKFNTLLKNLFYILLLTATTLNAKVTYTHTDALGSVIAESDESGKVIKSYHYAPYGESIPSVKNNNPGYTGHVYDNDLGLSYMKARYYNPEIGRFYSNDPVGFSADNTFSFNRYAYANNNPYKFVDPDGKETAVSIGGATEKNFLGHTAIAFTGKGVYSYGTGTEPGSSFSEYLEKQATYRDTTIYIIDTTPEQETKMLAEIMKYKNIKLPNPKKNPIDALSDTCASRTKKALEAGGVNSILAPFPSPFPADTEIVAKRNSQTSIEVRQGEPIPKDFETFNK